MLLSIIYIYFIVFIIILLFVELFIQLLKVSFNFCESKNDIKFIKIKEVSNIFNFNEPKSNLKYNTIEAAVSYILNKKNITTRSQLDKWCNKNHTKLYLEVEKIVPDAWERSQDPKSCVRFAYQKCLLGYSINNN